MTLPKWLSMTSEDLRAEIEKTKTELKRVEKEIREAKAREAKAKQRVLFAEALMTVCDEIEKEYAVVCMLKERAQTLLDERDRKRREAALKAAETRRRKAQDLRDAYAYDAWLEIAMDQESYDDDMFADDQSISGSVSPEPES